MGQITGTVVHHDGSPASGRRVSGLVAGIIGGMVGPVSTDSRGRFLLSWSSSSGLAKLYVDGSEHGRDLTSGEDVAVRL